MTDYPASHRDLLAGQTFATFTTFAPSGYPQVTAVSFFFDEEDQEVKLSLNETRKKIRNLQRDSRCTLFLLDFANPLRYLEIRADAELTPDEGKVFAARAGAKYGQDFTQHDQPGEERFVVTLRPVAVNAVNIGG